MVEKVSNPTTVAAVFDNKEAVENFVQEVRKADLGFSINISASIENAQACCRDINLAASQRGILAGFHREDGPPGRPAGAGTVHDVRTRYDLVYIRAQDD